MVDDLKIRVTLLLTGLTVFSASTYLSYLYPPPTPDWFYYGFIAKYYAEHGHYPKKSWWRKDQPPFIYRSPIIPICSLLVKPSGGPRSDYRFLIALTFGTLGSIISFLIDRRMGSIVPWTLTAAYMLLYAGFLGSKRMICLLTYPVLGTLLAKSLVTNVRRRDLVLSACFGTITGLFYDGWLEVLPLIIPPLTVPNAPQERRSTFLKILGMFIAGAGITVLVPNPDVSASHGLLLYHRPGLVWHMLGKVSEWGPPRSFLIASISWFSLIVLPTVSLIIARRSELIKLKISSIIYTSMGSVVYRFGISYLMILSPLIWYDLESATITPLYSTSLVIPMYWSYFWQKYPNWKSMKPVILENLRRGKVWGNGPPFEAWLYYEVDRVPPKVTPYDMDWRGYEKPLRKPVV